MLDKFKAIKANSWQSMAYQAGSAMAGACRLPQGVLASQSTMEIALCGESMPHPHPAPVPQSVS